MPRISPRCWDVQLGAEGVGGVGGGLAGVVLADVGEPVAAAFPQRGVVALAPGEHHPRAPALASDVDEVGALAGDDDFGDAAGAQGDAGEGVGEAARRPGTSGARSCRMRSAWLA